MNVIRYIKKILSENRIHLIELHNLISFQMIRENAPH